MDTQSFTQSPDGEALENGLENILFGRFGLGLAERDESNKCYVFVNLLTPAGFFSEVRLFDELDKTRNIEGCRDYNAQATKENRPIRIPVWLDYAIRAASLIKIHRHDCSAGTKQAVEHCKEHIWIPDARSTVAPVSSTRILYQHEMPACIEQGVGLAAGCALRYSYKSDIAGSNVEILDNSSLRQCLEAMVFENLPGRARDVLVWSMNPLSRKAYLYRRPGERYGTRMIGLGFGGYIKSAGIIAHEYGPSYQGTARRVSAVMEKIV